MREVMGGCKVCGKRMLTNGSPLIPRTCDACKTEQRRAHSRKTTARRSAERRAVKAKMKVPRCEQCGKAIKDAVRLTACSRSRWMRRFCSNACRKAAFRERHG